MTGTQAAGDLDEARLQCPSGAAARSRAAESAAVELARQFHHVRNAASASARLWHPRVMETTEHAQAAAAAASASRKRARGDLAVAPRTSSPPRPERPSGR